MSHEAAVSSRRTPRAVPLRFDPDSHDALVLVHPTYLRTRRPKHYPYRLLDAVDLAIECGRPVFHVPDYGHFKWLRRHLEKRELVPVPNHLRNVKGVKCRYLRRRLQREVDFIAGRLSKTPAEIHLAFAGMYAPACVFSVAQSWCRRVVPWWPDWSDPQLRSSLPKRCIASGEILGELVVGLHDDPFVLTGNG
ncbi:MAG: hypothetical protein GF346_11465 [Candidatus Eisenbacteria bacterium]|nr:hypothetical protein [Candidatus Latescibacterota bacterium]MBD3303054.1 hypothetical protein [Candidatus Eisenbacteria bacterium]